MSHKSISHDPHAVKQLAFQLGLTEDALWDVVGRPIEVALDMNDQDESESGEFSGSCYYHPTALILILFLVIHIELT